MKQMHYPEKSSNLLRVRYAAAIWLLCGLIGAGAGTAQQNEPFSARKSLMIEHDLKGRSINDPAVLSAMRDVPRHLFVPAELAAQAYDDYPLPIGESQTISQPYVVALMTQSLGLKKGDRVLEIGTGSGYQAAVLAEIVQQVFSVEIKKTLADRAAALLKKLGYRTIQIKTGDGFQGWKEHAPYDAIMVTCAVDRIPPPLIGQLKEGGRIILPLGETVFSQELVLGLKKNGKIEQKYITGVRFVPMTGEAQQKKDPAQ